MTEPGMMNIYWTKIKLRTEVVGSLYLNSYVFFYNKCYCYTDVGFLREGSDQSRLHFCGR